MIVRVLVVDDSVILRSQITESLKSIPGVEVGGVAANHKIALQKLEQGSFDLVILTADWPVHDGLETLREIKNRGFPCRVIALVPESVFSTGTVPEIISVGAKEVVLRPPVDKFDVDAIQMHFEAVLSPRVRAYVPAKNSAAPRRPTVTDPKAQEAALLPETHPTPRYPVKDLTRSLFQCVVIASSTGGPAALEAVFSQLKGPFRKPVLLAQHMGPVFTQILAKRLSEVSGLPVREARNGEVLVPGEALIAPGDFHLMVRRKDDTNYLSLEQGPPRNSVRPAADHLFESACEIFGQGTLGVVLTGMGEDGAQGAHAIKEKGGGVVIQDKASCVVFGMPGAVYQNGDFDEMGDLPRIAGILNRVLAA